MSFRGRHVIDRIKRSVGRWLKLPVPPYENTNYWEGVYQSLGADDVFEWADVSCRRDLAQYQYRPVPCRQALRLEDGVAAASSSLRQQSSHEPITEQEQQEQEGSGGGDGDGDGEQQQQQQQQVVITTTLQETLGLVDDDLDNEQHAQAPQDQPVLILGCGNSEFGEDLLDETVLPRGCRGTPVVQIDCSQRVVETLSARCQRHLENGDMIILQDDATVLSAVPDASCAAIVDKGLLDGLFCADAYTQCWEVLHAAHRVLRPDGTLVVLSLSRPEFILRKLMIPGDEPQHNPRYVRQWQAAWSNIECRQSDFIYLYRFTKASGFNKKSSSSKKVAAVHNVIKKRKRHT